jgi:predicted dehydrogenase
MAQTQHTVLIIGGGTMAERNHIPSAIEIAGAERTIVAEPVASRRAELADRFDGARLVPDYRDVLSEANVAVVVTPPHLHAPISCACLEAGLHVLCEKPLANTVAECERMQAAAETSRRILAVVHNYRFFPGRARVREEILGGRFGDDVAIEVLEGAPTSWVSQTGYTFRKELMAGGVLLNQGTHSVDFLLWCLGKPEVLDYRDDSLGALESNADLQLGFDHGAARLRISRTASLANRITISGGGREATMALYEMNGWRERDGRSERVETVGGRTVGDFRQVARAQLADFLAAVDGNRSPCADGAAGLAVVSVIERAYSIKRERVPPRRAPVPGTMW